MAKQFVKNTFTQVALPDVEFLANKLLKIQRDGMKTLNVLLAMAIFCTPFTVRAEDLVPVQEFGTNEQVAPTADVAPAKIPQSAEEVAMAEAMAAAAENPFAKLDWKTGPSTHAVPGKAAIVVPENYYFLNTTETQKYSELAHNPSSGNEVLLTDKTTWEAYFSFQDVGYVKDDETIDADELLNQYKTSVKAGNDLRKEKGWSTLDVEGWFIKPHYDNEKKVLEWAILLKDTATREPVVNFSTKVLGRRGTVTVVLVARPDSMNAAVVDLKDKLNGFKFDDGGKYTEFQEGDKVAEYGLAALILGGAAAVATKKGFFTVILAFLAGAWKLLLIPFVFALGWLKSLFTKKPK